MDTSLALTIIGSVMILVGLIFNAIPKVVNEKIMGELHPEAVNIAALFRVILGGIAIAIGVISVYCRGLPSEHASTLLFSLGLGFIVINFGIISGKFRGFGDELPLPPIIMFILLSLLAFYAS